MSLTGRGVMCAITGLVALACSLTALGVTADYVAHSEATGASWRAELKAELHHVTWWQVTVLTCTSVASLAALLLLAFQLLRCCCSGHRSGSGVMLALSGCLAHIGAFVAFTIYLAKDFAVDSFGPVESWGRTLESFFHKHSNSTAAALELAATGPACLASHNAFHCYSSWPAKWQAMWTFGLVVGTAFWLLTLLLAALDRSAASSTSRQVADVPHTTTDTIMVDEALLRTHGKAPKQQQFCVAV